jgi:hypothetical protein
VGCQSVARRGRQSELDASAVDYPPNQLDNQLPRHPAPAAFPALRRTGNPQTHRSKELPTDLFRMTISPGIPSEAFCILFYIIIINTKCSFYYYYY